MRRGAARRPSSATGDMAMPVERPARVAGKQNFPSDNVWLTACTPRRMAERS